MKWLDYNEWKFMLAWKHYQHILFLSFGINEVLDEEMKEFKKQYSEKYPKNAKILKFI